MKVLRMSQDASQRIETAHQKLLGWLWDLGLIDGHGSAADKLGIGEVYAKSESREGQSGRAEGRRPY